MLQLCYLLNTKGDFDMKLLSSLFSFVSRRRRPVLAPLPPVEVHISPFNNVWNQLSLELARPQLCRGAVVNWDKVRSLRQQLDELV